MTSHTVERTARGAVAGITGTCGSDECPVEDVDPDDGSVTYTCPVTGDVVAETDAIDTPDTPDSNRPATTTELQNERRRRR